MSAYALNIKQGLYTHGGHIDTRRAKILKLSCSWVYISLDECTRTDYLTSKGVDRFDAVCDNVRGLVAEVGPATIGVGFLLHPNNVDRVHDMVRLGRALGADYVQFRPTIRYEQDDPDRPAESTDWIRHAVGLLNSYANDPFVNADIERFRIYQNWHGHGYTTCHWSALQTVITPNGKVWRCLNKREHADACLGDLTQESFADIWARAGGACAVDGTCRVMCRGHIPNLALDPIMVQYPHPDFV